MSKKKRVTKPIEDESKTRDKDEAKSETPAKSEKGEKAEAASRATRESTGSRALFWICNGLFVGGVILLFAAFAASTVGSGSTGKLWTRILAGAAAAFFVGAIGVGFRDIAAWVRTRATQEGLIALLYVAAVWVVIGFGVYMGIRYNARKDLTEAQVYTLSEKTREVVADLDHPVEMIACVKKGTAQEQQVEELLKLYEELGGKLTVARLNPDKHWDRMMALGITDRDNVVLVRREGAKGKEFSQTVSPFDFKEQKVTSAILNVTTETRKKVYFLSGHGEQTIDGTGAQGLSALKKLLEDDQYEVASLNLATEREVPSDATVVVIAGATMPFLDTDWEALRAWLDAGGRLLILAANRVVNTEAPDYSQLLDDWGVSVRQDIVCDPTSSWLDRVPSALAIAGNRVEPHPITEGSKGVDLYLDVLTCSLRVDEAPPQQPGMPAPTGTPVALLKSTDLSWGQSDLPLRAAKQGSDTPGPLVLAAAVEKTLSDIPIPNLDDAESEEDGQDKKAKVVVIGDGNMAVDADVTEAVGVQAMGLRTSGRYFVRDAVHWLAEAEDLIAIPPREFDDPPLDLSKAQVRWNRFFVFFGPALVLVVGLMVWYLRRG